MGYFGRIIGLTLLGLWIGVVFAAISLVVVLLAGEIEAVDGRPIALTTVLSVQIVGGIAGGLLAGVFNFLGRWTWGAAVLGVLGVLPWGLLGGRAFYGSEFGSAESISGLLVITVLLGSASGIYAKQEFGGFFPVSTSED